ncbi:MAG: arsenate reductase ArsC [Chloroflexi bacterium]|nr:arsenate reductase ArsC [Chloroflexota bacterium]
MKTVLFVCIHNSGRSQIAEAFFNHLAKGKARAISAGTEPGKQVQAEVVQVMKEVGIDISRNKPKALTEELLQQANRVITMGCMTEGVCPASFVETQDWALEDPKGKPLEKVRQIRDEIKARVTGLLSELGLQ